jgi:hypothetical protein
MPVLDADGREVHSASKERLSGRPFSLGHAPLTGFAFAPIALTYQLDSSA